MDSVYFLSDFPEQLAPVWSFLPCGDTGRDSYDLSKPLEMDGSQVQNLQKSINAHASELDIISKLQLVGSDFHVARQNKLLAQTKPLPGKSKKDLQKGVVGSSMSSSSLVPVDKKNLPVTPRKPEKPKVSKVPLKSALKKSQPVSILPLDSPLAKARIIGTVSRKLTYLMNKILEHHKTEKILIFFEDRDVAWYITQALEILGIENLSYSGSLSQERRATHLSVFQNSEKYRVLLMELSQAAHGLNVSCASRVFFINPVWRRDIEQQAMKRAHRIGQTRAVYVEILILVGTIEEAMWNRRRAMTAKERDGTKGGLIEDSKMRDIISNLKFLKVEPNDGAGTQQVSMLVNPEPIFGDGKHGGVYNEIEHIRPSPPATPNTPSSVRWRSTSAAGPDERITSDLPTGANVTGKPLRAKVRWIETSPRKNEAGSGKSTSLDTSGNSPNNSTSSVSSPTGSVDSSIEGGPPRKRKPSGGSAGSSAGPSRPIKRKKMLGFKAGDDRDWMEDSDDDFGVE